MQTEGEIIGKILESFKNKPVKELFKAWHLLFKRSYSLDTEEAKSRYRIFKDNLAYINENNAKNNGLVLGLNQFSDLTNEEYRQGLDSTYAKTYAELSRETENKAILSGTWKPVQSPASGLYNPVDHTPHFLPPRNQGSCGSCWAFAATGNVEAILSLANGGANKAYLSPQQMVDCDKRNGACKGGFPPQAFDYFIQNGVTRESNYPYKNFQQTCNSGLIINPARIRSYEGCMNKDCVQGDAFYNMLKKGPVTVGLDANSRDFQSYQSGIMNTTTCTEPNHAVIAAGYGVYNGIGYWIIRNSWGPTWGQKGHVFVAHTPNLPNGSCFLDRNGWLPIL
jgi:hypothetical protein